MVDLNRERKAAVRGAWKNEREHVRSGNGTRDWSQSEQKQILSKGKANGYEGHHMKSVKEYPQYAGDPKNIQFLNRNEHVNGVHKGSTQNPTNGYYDPKTGTMHSFGSRPPQSPQAQPLSSPITQHQQNLAAKREQAKKQAAQQAKSEARQPLVKTTPAAQSQNATAGNKGIEAMRNKTSNSQSTNQNKGIEAARQKSAASPQGGEASGAAKGAGASSGKPSGGQSK